MKVKMKKYFAVKNVELPDCTYVPGYFGKEHFASTHPTPNEIETFGFDTRNQAFDELCNLAKIFGTGNVHGYAVVEL